MIVNPYNKNIIITKSFKQTQAMRQALKLQYISLFATCNCALDLGPVRLSEVLLSASRAKPLLLRIDPFCLQPRAAPGGGFQELQVAYLGNPAARERTCSMADPEGAEAKTSASKRSSLQQRNRLSRKSVVFERSASNLPDVSDTPARRSEEHTSELQSR